MSQKDSLLTFIVKKTENNNVNGGKKGALESVSPLPQRNDHPEGDIPQEELEEDKPLQDATVQEPDKNTAQMKAILLLEGRVRSIERFMNKFFGQGILSEFFGNTQFPPFGALDARSALVFPKEKQECFLRCWFTLYADVRNAEKLDCFFAKLRVCRSEDEIVGEIKRLVEDFSNLRKNKFLRSQEGIENLCSLLDNPFVPPRNTKNLSRRVTNNIKDSERG